MEITVRNLRGTSDNSPSYPYDSWLDMWKNKKHVYYAPDCSCINCGMRANVGAHIQKFNDSDKKWYIVPLCYFHNNQIIPFEVEEEDLIPANNSQY